MPRPAPFIPVGGLSLVRVMTAAGLLTGLTAAPACAQTDRNVRTVGPGRIVCNASFCELGSGAHVVQRFRIDISALPDSEIKRLRRCTGVSKPCIVTILGTQWGDPMKVMADSIEWRD